MRQPFLIVVSFLCLMAGPTIAIDLRADDVDDLVKRATTAWESENFAQAAPLWQQIVDENPESPQIAVALYRAGFSYMRLQQYDKSIELLQQSITKSSTEDNQFVPEAYLYLGFAQSKVGEKFLELQQPQKANQQLTTATETFANLMARYSDFSENDQALFFQGDAFAALGRMEDAANSYSKMLKLKEDPEFKLAGLLALGSIRAQQGRFQEAHEFFSAFEAEGQQDPAFPFAKFQNAHLLTELASASENRGDQGQANLLLGQAAEKLEAVYLSGQAGLSDKARFEQAKILSRLQRYGESAEAFESVVQISDSPLVDEARVYAGRDFMRSGNGNVAIQLLQKSVSLDSAVSPLAAHWLSKFYLSAQQADRAYNVAEQWLVKTDDPSLKILLMRDKADAALEMPGKKTEAQQLYVDIATQYPTHPLAAVALYLSLIHI